MANAITTNVAREKLVKARSGDITLPKITHMVFGDGGVDINGAPIAPDASNNTLKNKLLKKPIDKHSYPTPNTCRYICKLNKDELASKNINEIGLLDETGDIVAIKTFGSKYKDSDMEMIFEIDDEF